MGSIKLALAVEDRSDADVIEAVVKKITRKTIKVRPYVGNGCGKISSKCAAWAEDAKRNGCKAFVVVHDLDEKVLEHLRGDLSAKVGAVRGLSSCVVIPIREIEAWLLADTEAIQIVVGKKVKSFGDTELLLRPKEKLSEVFRVKSGGRIRYLNTVHNQKIAEKSKVANLAKCASFRVLRDFILAI